MRTQHEARKGVQPAVPLLASVDGGIYLSRSHEERQMVLNETSKLYSLLGLERNGGKSFAVELDPERASGRHCPNREPPYISTWVERDGSPGHHHGT